MGAPVILIVDDVAATRTGLAQLLRLKGYDTLEAPNGEDGLRVLLANPHIRVVVLDLNMPGTSGYWFRDEQRKRPAVAHVPVIAFTGGEMPDESFGFRERLRKPISVGALLTVLEACCLGESTGSR
jgi:CheY-like chemotaxis protein